MSDATVRAVHVDVALSQLSIAYKQEDFVADKAAPPFRVVHESDKFFVKTKSNFRLPVTLREDGTPANEVGIGWTTDTYSCKEHALRSLVTDRVKANSDAAIQPEMSATEELTELIALRKEKDAATLLFTSTNWASGHTASPSTKWDAGSGTTVFNDVDAARQKVRRAIGREPNTMLMGRLAFDALKDNGEVLDRLKYTALAVITEDLIAQMFQIKNVLVGRAIEDTAAEGAPASTADIWTDHVLVCYVDPAPGLRRTTAALGFTSSGGRVVRTWRDEPLKGTYIEVDDIYDLKIVDSGSGYLLTDVTT